MDKTRNKLVEYWDDLISTKIPSYVSMHKLEEEIKEHFVFLKWAFKRIIIPLAIAYIIAGLFLKINILGSLVLAMLVFLYSNSLPDVDFLMKTTRNKVLESKWYEKYALLFFAPLVIYYILDGRKKPIYISKDKYFHSFKIIPIYGFFLFILGMILWQQPLKMIILPLFGMLGFSFHLIVDGRLNNILKSDIFNNRKNIKRL